MASRAKRITTSLPPCGNDSPRRRGPHLTFVVLAALSAISAHAANDAPSRSPGYQIVAHDDSAITYRIADDLAARLAPLFEDARAGQARRRPTFTVTIGPAALRKAVARRCDCVIVAAYTSSQVFHEIVGGLPAAQARAITAVYAEPAPADQLRLADLLYRRPVRAAAIVGPGSAFLKPELAADRVVVVDADGARMGEVLERIAQTDVLLALPDRAIYNPDSFRSILLATYRHKQGVIGFSSDMVRAGALATTYSEIEDIDAQVTVVAAAYVDGGALAPPRFPRYFRTAINDGVARSLDIAVGDDARRFASRPAQPAARRTP